MAEKDNSGAEALGLTSKEPFDPKAVTRPETNEKSQKPEIKRESVSTDRGKFKVVG